MPYCITDLSNEIHPKLTSKTCDSN